MMQLQWNTIWQLLKKLNIDLPCDPAISFQGIYTKELETENQICVPVLTTNSQKVETIQVSIHR
jgi:hypothetical protein